MNSIQVKVENQSKPATKKQLWALFVASKRVGEKHDYRNDNLTMLQASELLAKFNAQTAIAPIGVQTTKVAPKNATERKKNALESEFISFMKVKMCNVIKVAKESIKIKSVVSDDTHIPEKDRKQFAFFGNGCGISIINYDKRSKVGKKIIELSDKHQMTTFLKMFLEGFQKEQIKYFEEVGFPLQAMYYQDIRISGTYENAVADFMTEKGVKKVWVKTFLD